MADNINNGGGNSAMGFIVGGLVVVLVIFAIFYFSGNMPGKNGSSTSISVETPSAPATTPSK